MLVAGDQVGRLRAERGPQGLRLRRLAGLASFDLDDLDRTKGDPAPRRARPLGVVARQRRGRITPQSADGDDR
jgi:hypothetical protein